ncbi:MAG: hypothetical protein ACXW1W_08055 [Methylococcaceae bacterium]
MKTYPVHDTEFSLDGDRLHFDVLLTEAGSFGLKAFSLGTSMITVEIDRHPLPLQEISIGFVGQDAQDFIEALRGLLSLLDAGS